MSDKDLDAMIDGSGNYADLVDHLSRITSLSGALRSILEAERLAREELFEARAKHSDATRALGIIMELSR